MRGNVLLKYFAALTSGYRGLFSSYGFIYLWPWPYPQESFFHFLPTFPARSFLPSTLNSPIPNRRSPWEVHVVSLHPFSPSSPLPCLNHYVLLFPLRISSPPPQFPITSPSVITNIIQGAILTYAGQAGLH